jgi:hypothetical protein
MNAVAPVKALLAIVRSNCFHVLSTAGVDVGWAMEEI